jgi:hypothetical protein
MCQHHPLQSCLGALPPFLLPTPLLGLQHLPSLYSPLLSHPLLIREKWRGCTVGSLHGRVRYNDIVISGWSPNPISPQSSGYH